MLRNVGQILSERARLSSEIEAIVDLARNRRIDYATLNARTNALATIFHEEGVKKGDRVAILMSNSHVYMEAYFALAKIGAIAVLLNWRLTPAELEYIVQDCSASTLIFSEDLESLVEALKPLASTVKCWMKEDADLDARMEAASKKEPQVEIAPDDAVFIMYTSGTTGKPKGAVMTHGASVAWHYSAMATADTRYRERCYTVAPLFHIGGIGVVTSAIHRGMTNVIDQMFDPGRVWRMIAREKIGSTFLVPAMLNFMLKHEEAWTHDHSHLRGIMCGAAPVPVSLIEAFTSRGVDIHQVYGATETHGGICLMTPEKASEKAGSTGRPYYGLEVRVVDEDGHDVPPGVPGEVITRGPHVLREYWNKPEETAKSFKDGWFYLGDVAEVDADGFIYIKDRSKDMVISGGENIYPAEVENVLLSHQDVAEVAVIGQPSEKWGESVCAVVVPKPDVDVDGLQQELMAISAEKLASYKRPKAFEFIGEIPRNPSGKALKRVLRERFPGPAPE